MAVHQRARTRLAGLEHTAERRLHFRDHQLPQNNVDVRARYAAGCFLGRGGEARAARLGASRQLGLLLSQSVLDVALTAAHQANADCRRRKKLADQWRRLVVDGVAKLDTTTSGVKQRSSGDNNKLESARQSGRCDLLQRALHNPLQAYGRHLLHRLPFSVSRRSMKTL